MTATKTMSKFVDDIADAVEDKIIWEKVVDKATTALPQTGTATLFTIVGKIKLLDITGEVTTQIQAQNTSVRLVAYPTTASLTNLCGVLNITGDAKNTLYKITGTPADAMIAATNGVASAQARALIIPEGTIKWTSSASSTGNVKWSIRYVPLTEDGDVVPS